MADDFNGSAEPMRAIRDLISACETAYDLKPGDSIFLDRARAGFETLRALHGDTRPAENIADAPMREPDFALVQLLSGALQCVAKLLPDGEQHVIHFTDAYVHLGSPPISAILDMANTALEGVARSSFPRNVMN